MFRLIWRWKKWLIGIWLIVIIPIFFAVLAMPVAYTSEAQMLLFPTERVIGGGENLEAGGVFSRILGAGGTRDAQATVALLKSRLLLDQIVAEMDLKPELFPKAWDEKAGAWRDGKEEPSTEEARRALDASVDIAYDEFTGLLELAVHRRDPVRAYEIATEFLQISHRMLKGTALIEGNNRVLELQAEIEKTKIEQVSTSLVEAMTRAITTLASIRASADYGFRIIDPPTIPEEKSWPPRSKILLILGFVLGVAEIGVVVGFHLRNLERENSSRVS